MVVVRVVLSRSGFEARYEPNCNETLRVWMSESTIYKLSANDIRFPVLSCHYCYCYY